MSKHYIAYGSNLAVDQMLRRCPGARIEGKAELQDWRLAFHLHATIIPEPGFTVPVLIWEITEKDETALDWYEGYPNYYRKETVPVTMTDLNGKNPREVEAMVYIMNSGSNLITPSKGYYDIIADGYDRFGFDKGILERAFEDALEEEMNR
ncbi:MAG: gamma-glutamylcyclotransferase [Oscillospiraceae bacterium]|nr:gamma-glutamylcyclotransferase [Oscillospiraceae bacterium]